MDDLNIFEELLSDYEEVIDAIERSRRPREFLGIGFRTDFDSQKKHR